MPKLARHKNKSPFLFLMMRKSMRMLWSDDVVAEDEMVAVETVDGRVT